MVAALLLGLSAPSGAQAVDLAEAATPTTVERLRSWLTGRQAPAPTIDLAFGADTADGCQYRTVSGAVRWTGSPPPKYDCQDMGAGSMLARTRWPLTDWTALRLEAGLARANVRQRLYETTTWVGVEGWAGTVRVSAEVDLAWGGLVAGLLKVWTTQGLYATGKEAEGRGYGSLRLGPRRLAFRVRYRDGADLLPQSSAGLGLTGTVPLGDGEIAWAIESDDGDEFWLRPAVQLAWQGPRWRLLASGWRAGDGVEYGGWSAALGVGWRWEP